MDGMAAVRVLRIIARMNVGGPAVEISGLMRHLDGDRFDQRLLTGWCDPHEEDYLTTQATDIKATRITGLGRAVRPTEDANALWQLVKQIREFRPHILHTHTAKAGALGRAAAEFAGARPIRVHTYHGHVLNGYFSGAKTKAIVQVEKSLAWRTDALITVGAQVRDELLAAGIGKPTQYSVIPPGLEPLQFPTRSEARATLGLDPNSPVVCVVGRVTQIKRPDRVADVARILGGRFPGLTILVAGAGDLQEELAHRVATEQLPITMLGWRDDVETIFAASDLALLTSDNEGTPLSLIQAALAGIPSVATNVGAVHEVVLDAVTGILTPCDPELMAGAVASLLENPERQATMGEAGRVRAEDLYTVQRFAEAHGALYESLIAAKARTAR